MNCPACQASDLFEFHHAEAVPVHVVRLLHSREEAVGFPRGRIALACCRACGFIWNSAFERRLLDYGTDYEETQGYSETFGAFHEQLVGHLMGRYRLQGKHVVEVGCGKGEFLNLLCERGVARGTGIDPSYVPERNTSPARERVEVFRDLLSEAHAGLAGDFVCCKMTLEHIDAPADFVGLVKSTLVSGPEVVTFFQVPNARRLLCDGAFWDVYYEHCSYFTAGSLARLFRRAGFEILDLWTGYDDQYLMVEARLGEGGAAGVEEPVADLLREVEVFRDVSARLRESWRGFLSAAAAAGRRVVLWGGGSKAVSFLTTPGLGEEVDFVVDINPHKRGSFLPGSGHRVLGPEDLPANPPDCVIVMNPIYRDEIARSLRALGLAPELITVERGPEGAVA